MSVGGGGGGGGEWGVDSTLTFLWYLFGVFVLITVWWFVHVDLLTVEMPAKFYRRGWGGGGRHRQREREKL